jgi:hypothetical protein
MHKTNLARRFNSASRLGGRRDRSLTINVEEKCDKMDKRVELSYRFFFLYMISFSDISALSSPFMRFMIWFTGIVLD